MKAVDLYEGQLFGEALQQCMAAGMTLSDALHSVADSGPTAMHDATKTARSLARAYREAT